MNKSRLRKLSMNRETLRRLDPRRLAGARGAELEPQGLFGSAICISLRCRTRGADWTCLGDTCLSCDGPVSCDGNLCQDTQPW